MNTQALLHLKHYCAFCEMLPAATGERKELLESECQRQLELYLQYSEGDTSTLEELGFRTRMENGQLIFLR